MECGGETTFVDGRNLTCKWLHTEAASKLYRLCMEPAAGRAPNNCASGVFKGAVTNQAYYSYDVDIPRGTFARGCSSSRARWGIAPLEVTLLFLESQDKRGVMWLEPSLEVEVRYAEVMQ